MLIYIGEDLMLNKKKKSFLRKITYMSLNTIEKGMKSCLGESRFGNILVIRAGLSIFGYKHQ